jgi:hypothetical protein
MTLKDLLCPGGSKRAFVNDVILFQSSMCLPIDVSNQLGLGEISSSLRELMDSKFETMTVESLNLGGNASEMFCQRDFHNE